MMNNLNNFVNELRECLSLVDRSVFNRTWGCPRGKNSRIKFSVGDSTRNNRVPSVNQVIKFLTRKNSSNRQRVVGNQLKNVYPVLRSKLRNIRLSERSDALDINEFLSDVYLATDLSANGYQVNAILGRKS